MKGMRSENSTGCGRRVGIVMLACLSQIISCGRSFPIGAPANGSPIDAGRADFPEDRDGEVIPNGACGSDFQLEWAELIQGGGNDAARGVAMDGDGSIYFSTAFDEPLIFSSQESGEVVVEPFDDFDWALAKFSSDGDFIWARMVPTGAGTGGGELAMIDGDVAAVGAFSGSATFGQNEPNAVTLVAKTPWDCFLARYAPDGNLRWAISLDTSADDRCWSLAVSDSSIVVSGYTFYPSAPSMFLARFTGKSRDWLHQWASDARSWETMVDDTGGIWWAGFFESSLFFAADKPQITTTGPLDTDIFLARAEGDGDLIWASSIRSPPSSKDLADSDWLTDLIAGGGGDALLSGGFDGNAHFASLPTVRSHGSADVYVARVRPDGSPAWLATVGGPESVGGGQIVMVEGCAVASVRVKEDVQVTSSTGEVTVAFENQPEGWILAGFEDDGSVAWARRDIDSSGLFPAGAASAHDAFALSGAISEPTTFGVGQASETTLEASGENRFVAKYRLIGRK